MLFYPPRKLKRLLDVLIPSPADNDALTYDAATEKWVPEHISGWVMQIIQSTYAIETGTYSITYADTPITATITLGAGNKLLILGAIAFAVFPTGDGGWIALSIDGAAEISEKQVYRGYGGFMLASYEDGLAAGAHTVTVRFKTNDGHAVSVCQNNSRSELILIEFS